MRRTALLLSVIAMILLAGCGVPGIDRQGWQLGDSRLNEFSEMNAINRVSLGLSSLPTTGEVMVDRVSTGGYDAVLHFYRMPSKDGKAWRRAKHVYFIKRNGKMVWAGELDVYGGPGLVDVGDDGSFHEKLMVSYFAESVAGQPEGLSVEYQGDDDRYARVAPTLEQAKSLIAAWQRSDW